jgi:hypothetical protein
MLTAKVMTFRKKPLNKQPSLVLLPLKKPGIAPGFFIAEKPCFQRLGIYFVKLSR